MTPACNKRLHFVVSNPVGGISCSWSLILSVPQGKHLTDEESEAQRIHKTNPKPLSQKMAERRPDTKVLVPKTNSFTLSRAFLFQGHLHKKKLKVHVQGKENIFYWKKNCTRVIKVSMVPQVTLCTLKGIPVSNTKKKIGQILKLSSVYTFPSILCLFVLLSTFSSLELKHQKCELFCYANIKGKERAGKRQNLR